MTEITGTIQSVRRDRKGVKIDDVWYSAYAASELNGAERGDHVKLTYSAKGDFKNIQKPGVEVLSKGEGQSSGGGGGRKSGGNGGGDKQFRTVPELNRIDALNAAVAVTVADTDTKERVKHVMKLVPIFVNVIENGTPTQAKAKATDDAAAKAAAEEAARKAAEEKAKREAEAAAAAEAQKEEAATALDDFLDD